MVTRLAVEHDHFAGIADKFMIPKDWTDYYTELYKLGEYTKIRYYRDIVENDTVHIIEVAYTEHKQIMWSWFYRKEYISTLGSYANPLMVHHKPGFKEIWDKWSNIWLDFSPMEPNQWEGKQYTVDKAPVLVLTLQPEMNLDNAFDFGVAYIRKEEADTAMETS